jgi:hypothetical protein
MVTVLQGSKLTHLEYRTKFMIMHAQKKTRMNLRNLEAIAPKRFRATSQKVSISTGK